MSNKNKTKTMQQNKAGHIKVWLLLLILFLVAAGIAIYFEKGRSEFKSTDRSVIKQGKKEIGNVVSNKENVSGVKLSQILKITPYSDLKDFTVADPRKLKLVLIEGDQERDVTEEADWGSVDPAVIYVSNVPGHKGEIVGQKIGKTTVFAQYKNKGASRDVEVKRAALKIHCEVSKTKARVGDEIKWMIIFDKVGVPRYKYKVYGDDGLNGESPVFFYRYSKPGKKHSKVWAEDVAGTTAEADCPTITITK